MAARWLMVRVSSEDAGDDAIAEVVRAVAGLVLAGDLDVEFDGGMEIDVFQLQEVPQP